MLTTAMGRRKRQELVVLVATADLPKSGGHPFYERVNRILDAEGGDRHDEARGAPLYADGIERPSLAPAVCFRLMLVGAFEGLDSERGIAWRTADSLALRSFMGFSLTDGTPELTRRDARGDGKEA